MPISPSTSSRNAQPAKAAQGAASSKRGKSAAEAKADAKGGKGARGKGTKRNVGQNTRGGGKSEQAKLGSPGADSPALGQSRSGPDVAASAGSEKAKRPAHAAKEAIARDGYQSAQAMVATVAPVVTPLTGGGAFAGLPGAGKALSDGVQWAQNLSGDLGRLGEKFFGQGPKQTPSLQSKGNESFSHNRPAPLTAEGGPFNPTYYSANTGGSDGAGVSDDGKGGDVPSAVPDVYLQEKKKIVTGRESSQPSVEIPATTKDRSWDLNDIETKFQYDKRMGDDNVLAAWLFNKRDDDYVAQVTTDLLEINGETYLRANLYEPEGYKLGEGDRVSPTIDRAIRMADVNEKKLFLPITTPLSGRVNQYQLQALGFERVKYAWGFRKMFKDEGWVFDLNKIRQFLQHNPGL